MSTGSDVIVNRELRDGVATYWTPEAPRLTGALMFRVGGGDETPITRGVTHLVEHLALFGFGGRQPFQFNGFVDGTRTVFHATGTPDEVAGFITQVCTAIADLPIHRLVAESRVLRTEAAGRRVGPVDVLQWCRFGCRGHGLLAMPEYALEAPNPARVRAWAAERFTAENASAWFSGPIPDGVHFDALPHGRRWPCPQPEAIAELETPAFFNHEPRVMAISFVNDRSHWIAIPWTIAGHRLQERLRYREGVAYAVQSEFHPIATNIAHSTILTECLDAHAAAVQKGLLEVLDDLAQNGPTEAELRRIRDEWAREFALPEAVLSHLDPMALNELLGYPSKSWSEHLAELDEMTPESCAASVRTVFDTAILLLPAGCPPPESTFHVYPSWSRTTVRGHRFRAATQRFPWSKRAAELIVGAEGVSLVTPEGRALTVLYAECAGAVVSADGLMHLIGHDGCSLWIRASEWRDGHRACEAVLRGVPQSRLLMIPAR